MKANQWLNKQQITMLFREFDVINAAKIFARNVE